VKRRAIALLVAALAIAACRNGGSSVAELLGISDKPAPHAMAIDILCDPSRGSTCTAATLRRVLPEALKHAAARPGSTVRLWIQGRDVATTCMIAEVTSTSSKRLGKRARLRYEERWVAAQMKTLRAAAAPHLSKKQRRSPIAESITRIALTGTATRMPRLLTVITDGLEVSSLADFECGVLPTPKRFIRDLQRNDVLRAGSLKGMTVEFCDVDITPIDGNRCAVTLRRAGEITNLWSSAIRAAGAERFEIDRGDLHLQLDSQENGQ